MGPDGTVTYITQSKKWVNPTDKTAEQILLEIGDTIYKCKESKEDIDDLLNQACDVLWKEFQDERNSIYQFLSEQRNALRTSYKKQRSQVAKDRFLQALAQECRFRIEHYFKSGDA